jgi:hypothetical protein
MLKEPYVPVTITCRRELMAAVQLMREQGQKVSLTLGYVLGKWCEQYKTPEEAVKAMQEIYKNYRHQGEE